MLKTKLVPLSMIFFLSFSAFAAEDHMSGHACVNGEACAKNNDSKAMQSMTDMQKAYKEAMDKMHKPMMDGAMENDPDVAFVKGMIPHHQGAIDMANIELKYGKDPKIRELAKNIIKAQEAEIAQMNDWLKKHDHTPEDHK